jgi:hypothetical protein
MTGARVFGILKGRHPDFRLSYPTVQRCVRAAKTRISAEGLRQGFERLVWHAGESQMDFGEADFRRDDGPYVRLKHLVVSFPHSNKVYAFAVLTRHLSTHTSRLLRGKLRIFVCLVLEKNTGLRSGGLCVRGCSLSTFSAVRAEHPCG